MEGAEDWDCDGVEGMEDWDCDGVDGGEDWDCDGVEGEEDWDCDFGHEAGRHDENVGMWSLGSHCFVGIDPSATLSIQS